MPSIIPVALGALALLALFGSTAKASEQKPTPTPKPSGGPNYPNIMPPTLAATTPTITPTAAAAQTMVEHLKQVQVAAGSVTKAKGREDKATVSKFQKLANLTSDGKAGPGTLAAAALHGQTILPLVMYWPSGSNTAKVEQYRNTLDKIAEKLPPSKADELHASAQRERGQAGVAGGPLPA